jgi:hypothetical protein
MSSHRQSGWVAVLAIAASLSLALPSPAQVASAVQVDVGARELDVLRDMIEEESPLPGATGGRLCFDPTVASYRPSVSTPRERWSDAVLSTLAGDVNFSLDTLTTELPRGMPGCARSRKTSRVAYGRPRIGGDTGAMVVIRTRLDARGAVDSSKADFRLARKSDKWSVEGIIDDTMTVHRYVQGQGCYRLWYGPLDTASANRDRIDTTELRAESVLVGENWQAFPAYRLSIGPRSLGVAARAWPRSIWHVTHDSVHFEWTDTNQMVFADLLVVGDTLHGTMHSETDAVVPNPPTTVMRGRRISCG